MSNVMAEWLVSSEESGLKLSAFIKKRSNPEVSARQIKRSIETGHCLLNGKIERFASKYVGRGDRITFDFVQAEQPAEVEEGEDRFLYVDDHLVAYNKPAGLSSEDRVLLEKVRQLFPSSILLHRLDRDTTGVLLFGRDEKSSKAMLELFKQRQILKTYLAIVDGVPKALTGIVDNFLGKLHSYQGQTIWGAVPREKGLQAKTAWRLEKAGKKASLLVCTPETGRTHQIRVHLSSIGHPILGDYQYGRSFLCPYRPERLMLHAAEISFTHPFTDRIIKVSASLPNDFKITANHVL